MKKGSGPYLYRHFKLFLVTVLIFLRLAVFAQQPDTSGPFIVDTAIADGTDSTEIYTDDEESTEDSIQQAKYDYYVIRDEWDADSLESRQVPGSVIKTLKARDEFWYADQEFKKDPPPEDTKHNFWWFVTQQWFNTLIWIIIIGGFLTVLIWFLASSNVKLFSRRAKTIAALEDEQTSENIFGINFQQALDNAIKAGNYRLATRLLFLRALKSMSEKSIIQYKQDRTNFDYLLQLNSTAYYSDFFRLTRNYEYVWYGHFDVNTDAFSSIKNDFDTFNNRLH